MGFEDNPIVQVSPSSDANPLHVQALPDHCRQARTQLARIDGALERCTEARQQFVAAEPLAEDPPVGETLEGTPRRLEYQGSRESCTPPRSRPAEDHPRESRVPPRS